MTTQIVKEPTPEQVERASQFLKLASDPTRLKILWALLHGEQSVNDLAEHVGALAPAVSQHLAKLRTAGLVSVTREGNKLFYEMDNKHMRKAVEKALEYAANSSQK